MHYEKAGAVSQAAVYATADFWRIINQGQIFALQVLLKRLEHKQIEVERALRIKLALGEIGGILGDEAGAKRNYKEIITELEDKPDINSFRVVWAQACRGLAGLFEYNRPEEAVKWIKMGLERVAGVNSFEEGALYVKKEVSTLGWGISRGPRPHSSLAWQLFQRILIGCKEALI